MLERLQKSSQKLGIQTIDDLVAKAKTGALGEPLLYGGNTSCTEFTHGSQTFYVDAGSGIREAGTAALADNRRQFHILLTHLHWDHSMGFPFFAPMIYAPGFEITIYHIHKNAPEFMQIQFNGVNFPVKWEQLGAKITFREVKLYETVTLGDVSFTPFALDHPGGSFGYRFEAGGKSAAIGVDGEYKRVTPSDLGRDLKYYQNLDLLIFDAQYELEGLASRFDWGHSSPTIGIDLALREGIRNLALTHHDPWASEEKLYNSLKGAQKHLQTQLPAFKDVWQTRQQPKGPKLISAYDGLQIDL